MVLAAGVFDDLSIMHLRHLEEARKMGNMLYVAVTLDACVFTVNGKPANKWDDRADLLRALRIVHGVYACRTAAESIRKIRPDIFVRGIDFSGEDVFIDDIASACKEVGAELRYISKEMICG